MAVDTVSTPSRQTLESLEACKRGDREGLRFLFEAYKDKVHSLALHFCGDGATAWDLTQEVFLKVFSGIAEFRGKSSFDTWLYRIVMNACIDEQRKRQRFISFSQDLDAWQLTENRPQEEGCWRRQVRDAVQAAVADLRPVLKAPILLRYVEGLSYEEIAQVLGCRVGTVSARLHRGHKILARKLAALRGVV
jgi:RNA polymerase sigma-70 factor (ECF subfamily)